MNKAIDINNAIYGRITVIEQATIGQVKALARVGLLPEDTECFYCQLNFNCPDRYHPNNVHTCMIEGE